MSRKKEKKPRWRWKLRGLTTPLSIVEMPVLSNKGRPWKYPRDPEMFKKVQEMRINTKLTIREISDQLGLDFNLVVWICRTAGRISRGLRSY